MRWLLLSFSLGCAAPAPVPVVAEPVTLCGPNGIAAAKECCALIVADLAILACDSNGCLCVPLSGIYDETL